MNASENALYFFDTSALVKRYHREVGTDVITCVYCADRQFVAVLEQEGFSVIDPERA
jgi:hypothetical protein